MFLLLLGFRNPSFPLFFFFNDTATTEIYTLSLHDALPISSRRSPYTRRPSARPLSAASTQCRSEEHTSELQSQSNLVCRLLLEKKKKKKRSKQQECTPPKDRVVTVLEADKNMQCTRLSFYA